jgi:opacity protein-like surface antigen
MRKHAWLGVLVLGFLVCLVSAPAHAQDSKVNLFAGYVFGTNTACEFEDCCNCDPLLNGYAAAFAYNFNKHIGLEADFTGQNGTSTTFSEAATSDENGETEVLRQDIYTYTFGPKLSQPLGNFTLFTHFLVGAGHIHQGFSDNCLPETGETGSCVDDPGPVTEDTSGSKGTGFAYKVGGGVDWNHGAWGIRILEVDFVHVEDTTTIKETDEGTNETPFTEPQSANNFQLATGITFNIGGSK